VKPATSTPMISGNRHRSSDQIILACKAGSCPWDPYPPTVQEMDYYRTGWFWFKKIRCLNCGSLKIEKYAVGDVHFENRLGKPKYDRPPGWYDLKVYWGAARSELARRGYAGEVEVPEEYDEAADDDDGGGNVVSLKAVP
jgi:hypothetical protein